MRALAIVVLLSLATPAAASCRLALALGLDVSGSVDQTEYRLQLTGLADALGHPDVVRAIFAIGDAPVAVAIYEWSSSSYQRVVQDWVLLEAPADLERVTAALRRWQRMPAPEATGLGAALEFGTRLLVRAPDCWERTLDISGDGKNNDWPIPARLRAAGRLGEDRINALVVARTSDEFGDRSAAELSAYFEAVIIHGPDAFVEVAMGFDDYRRAMTRKLLRELSTLPLGHAPMPAPRLRPLPAAYQ